MANNSLTVAVLAIKQNRPLVCFYLLSFNPMSVCIQVCLTKQLSTQFRQPNLIKLRIKAYLEFKFLFSNSNVLSYLLGLYSNVLDVIDHRIFESTCRKKRRPQIFFNQSFWCIPKRSQRSANLNISLHPNESENLFSKS